MFHIVALGVAVFGGKMLIEQLKAQSLDPAKAIILGVTIVWIAVVCLIAVSLVLTLFGARAVSFGSTEVSVGLKVFGMNFGRARTYELSQLKFPSIEEIRRGYRGKEWHEYLVSFECNGIRSTLVGRLNARQAEAVLAGLQRSSAA